MKKTYLQPETYVENIQPISMMAESLPIDGNKEGSGALVKKDNDWDIWGSEGDEE